MMAQIALNKPTCYTKANPYIEPYTLQATSEDAEAVMRQNLISSFS